MKVQADRGDVLIWLHKQPRNVFLIVLGAILDLVSDPCRRTRPRCAMVLGVDCASLRVGDYRILYRLHGDELTIGGAWLAKGR